MIRLAYEVLPENRKEVNEYIGNVWTGVTTFVQSLKREKGTEGLKSKFEPYVVTEEAKLQRNLEGIKYDIDSYDTVQLIAGEGRVEMVTGYLRLCFVRNPESNPSRPSSRCCTLP